MVMAPNNLRKVPSSPPKQLHDDTRTIYFISKKIAIAEIVSKKVFTLLIIKP
jgi:hypothetical protein